MSQATLTHRPYVNSNLFSSHYLDERLQARSEWDCDDEAKHALEALQGLYELEGPLLSGYNEDTLIDNWIDEVLEIFGYGTQQQVALPDERGFVDELLFETPTVRREAATTYLRTQDTTELFRGGIGIVEAKQWDAAFDIRFSDQRPYRNASHQIKHYLENTPSDIQWGILTNGRKWRLYGTKDYETQTYYEVDLPELLENGDLEAFKYFYVFFRPAAFRGTGETTFLDEVWSESETASQELGESLQDNVFTALRVLGRGFVETNDDLEIAPDDEETLNELKEQSLVFLYRLMFILYAEARGLIHPESQSAQEEYYQNFSFNELRLDIHETIGEVDQGFGDEFSGYSTTIWNQLQDLFRLIDKGEKDLGIPPYNGGLFDQDEHEFLTEHEVTNQYLSEVIYRLSTTQNDEGRYVLADYADLDTRHLGSVYEGLLEHKFHIAPEPYVAVAEDSGQVWKPAGGGSVADAIEVVDEGGLYVVNDEGERKSTGAYYTPDYVVTYIVEETVGPLVEEIRHNLIQQGFEPGTQEYIGPFFRRITDLRILDPAMGSGHFLTKATGYLSEQVMAEVREVEEEFMWSFDEQHIRREIAKECVYGVDLNGMAVELAKLSMWLETLAADRPLAFLDHHFKQGNSLVGSDIEAIEELESDAIVDDEQASLAEFGATREGTIERLMDIYNEFLTIENETVEDVREMKRRYAEIEQDELRRRLVAMANVHTAERFDLDVPSGAYERMARALEDDEEWDEVATADWFLTAQSMAESVDFFHRKFTFPEVFYEDDGSKKENAGFDAVIGNPPYVRPHNIPDHIKEYLWNDFNTFEAKSDIYVCFIEQGIDLLDDGGYISFIISDGWFYLDSFEAIREYVLDRTDIKELVDLPAGVFADATVDTALFLCERADMISSDSELSVRQVPNLENLEHLASIEPYRLPQSLFEETYKNIFDLSLTPEVRPIKQKIASMGVKLGEIAKLNFGLKTGDDERFLRDEQETEQDKPLLRGADIGRYIVDYQGEYVWYVPDEMREHRRTARPGTAERFENPKVLVRDTHGDLICTYDSEGFFVKDVIIVRSDDDDYDNRYITALLNSTLIGWYYETSFPTLHVQRDELAHLPIRSIDFSLSNETRKGRRQEFIDSVDAYLSDGQTDVLGIVSESIKQNNESVAHDCLRYLVDSIIEIQERYNSVNLKFLDYMKPYSDGLSLNELGVSQPPEGVGDTILSATSEEYSSLRVGGVTCERHYGSITILATARYKPEDEDAYETDRWGYTETDLMPAMQLSDLSETEAALVEVFVPMAVEKADGFAGFRETATKTKSLVDRLEEIRLPDPDDVADDLKRYRETVERAEELDEKIQRTDFLIDEIVYKLYGLTDEEIKIIEATVGNG